MKQKRIKVTGRHIREGIPEEADACPIAQAILERKNVIGVSVDDERAEIHEHLKGGTLVRVYKLPRAAWNFITKFDAGKPVKPFSFKLGALIEEFEE